MTEKDKWFRDELERQRKNLKYMKWLRNVSLFLLGGLCGMIIQGLCIESKASLRLLFITMVWSVVVAVMDDRAFRIKLKIKRMEEMLD